MVPAGAGSRDPREASGASARLCAGRAGFGERELAHRWLCQPKRRLHGRVPLLLCQYGRYAAMIEQWLVNIDEGNGP